MAVVFSSGFENAPSTGCSDLNLLDNGAWDDYGPGGGAVCAESPPIAEVIASGAASGSKCLRVHHKVGDGDNGPDFRISYHFDEDKGVTYYRVKAKWDSNWRWSPGQDHKLFITGELEENQRLYYNLRGAPGGASAYAAIHIILADTVVSDQSVTVPADGEWHVFELGVQWGSGGWVRAKMDGVLLTLTTEAGTEVDPENVNPGPGGGFIKCDTTYNNFAYFEAHVAGGASNVYFDDVEVDDEDWVGGEGGGGGGGACDAPPTNDAAATATVIASLPYSHTQTCLHFEGTTYPAWYRWTATFTGVIGILGRGAGSYVPQCDVFTGPDPGTLAEWPLGVDAAVDRPLQIPVVSGEAYYFRFTSTTGDPDPSTLTLGVQAAPTTTAPRGSIVVPDDTDGFPAAIVSATTGAVLAFRYPFPAGEAGDRLRGSGEVLVADAVGGDLHLYDSGLNLITEIAFNIATSLALRAQNTLGSFFVGQGGSPPTVRQYSPAGTLLSAHTLTGYSGVTGIAANNAGTVLYHARGASAVVRRWDLVNDVALSDLAAGVSGYDISDILVFEDDSVLVLYYNFSTLDLFVRRYDPSGTLLDTYAIGTSVDLTIPRLAYALDDDLSFWVWFHADDGVSRFQQIQVSDGAVLTDLSVTEFELGVSQAPADPSPDDVFGISFSCPFFLLGETIEGEEPPEPGEEAEIGPIVWVRPLPSVEVVT